MRPGMFTLVLGMALACVAQAGDDPPVEGIGAREAVIRALDRGVRGQVIRLDSLSAGLGHRLARTPFLPGLDLGAGLTATRTLQSGDNPDFGNLVSNAGLTLGWTLFRGMAGLADSRRATAEALRSTAVALQAGDALALETLDAWHLVRLAERRLDIARETERISRERTRQDSLRRSLGAVSPQVLLNGRLALQGDLSSRLAREQELRAARVRLSLLVGSEGTWSALGQDSLVLAGELPGAGEFVEQTLEHGPDVTLARLDETIALQRERAANGGLLPRLDLLGTVGVRNSRTTWQDESETDLDTRSAAAGVTLSWELYNGGQSAVNRQRARISTRQATLSLEQARWKAEEDALLALDRWQTVDRQRDLAREGVEVARRQLEVVSRQYALGSAGSLDFRDAQLAVAGAEQNLAALDRDWILSRLEIERLRGRLLDSVLGNPAHGPHRSHGTHALP